MKKIVSIIALVCLVLTSLVIFASCGNKDTEEAYQAKLEKAGYSVYVTPKAAAIYKGCDFIIEASNPEKNASVLIEKYQKEEDAKAALETAQALGSYAKFELKGTTLFCGTEQGIKDAKK